MWISHKKPTFTWDFVWLNTNHEIERSVFVPKATMSHVMCSWSEPKEKSNKKTATTFLLAHYVKTIAHILLALALFASLFSFFLKCGLVHMHFDFECQIRKKITLETLKALFCLYRFLSFFTCNYSFRPKKWQISKCFSREQ